MDEAGVLVLVSEGASELGGVDADGTALPGAVVGCEGDVESVVGLPVVGVGVLIGAVGAGVEIVVFVVGMAESDASHPRYAMLVVKGAPSVHTVLTCFRCGGNEVSRSL